MEREIRVQILSMLHELELLSEKIGISPKRKRQQLISEQRNLEVRIIEYIDSISC